MCREGVLGKKVLGSMHETDLEMSNRLKRKENFILFVIYLTTLSITQDCIASSDGTVAEYRTGNYVHGTSRGLTGICLEGLRKPTDRMGVSGR
jgi:hypothetical protein